VSTTLHPLTRALIFCHACADNFFNSLRWRRDSFCKSKAATGKARFRELLMPSNKKGISKTAALCLFSEQGFGAGWNPDQTLIFCLV